MPFLLYVFIFLFGLAVGSFLNAVLFRMEKGESALRGRSYCPRCRHVLAVQDLIPVLSFFWLQGKCRYCTKHISFQYPIVELVTGFLFLFVAWQQLAIINQQLASFNIIQMLYLLVVTSLLIIIFVFDFKHYIIPDNIIYSAIGISFLYRVLESVYMGDVQLFTNSMVAAFLAAGFFLVIFLISRGRWMGFGDVKLALFMGLFLGWPNILVALFLAFFIGAIIGIGLISLKKKQFKSEIPFGPFLILGTFIALFFGNKLMNWYMSLSG